MKLIELSEWEEKYIKDKLEEDIKKQDSNRYTELDVFLLKLVEDE